MKDITLLRFLGRDYSRLKFGQAEIERIAFGLGIFGAELPPRFGAVTLGDSIHGIAMSKEHRGQHFWRVDSCVAHGDAWL